SAGGCDSIVTLNLTVLPALTSTIYDTICQGQTYTFNGNTYDSTQTVTASFSSSGGCDSIVTLNLTVLPALANTVYDTICQGQTYSFNGSTYNSTQTVTATFISTGGCDSIVTLNLTVLPALTSTIYDTICQGQTYTFNGNTYNSTQTVTATFISTGGCDSIVTLNLTVLPALTSTIYDTICQGQTYTFNGSTYNSTQSVTATFSSTGGCDSIVIFNLTVLPALTNVLYDTICQGQTYSFNGSTYNSTQTVTANFSSSGGCDSIVTLHFFVLPYAMAPLYTTICQGKSFVFNVISYPGNAPASMGITDTLQTAQGCDSIVTLNLTVLPALTSTVYDTICQGQTYTFNGNTYNGTQIVTATFSSSGGCDSIVTLNLTVLPALTNALYDTICQGQTYTFNGNTYNSTQTVTATFSSAGGCDSIVTLNLTVLPALT